MKKNTELEKELLNLDQAGYKAYKKIKGIYDFNEFVLFIDHVQGDPFAAPSKMRIRKKHEYAGFPENTRTPETRAVAFRDFIARKFWIACKKLSSPGRKGSGKSGLISIEKPGQEILERSSVKLNSDWIETRFVMGLPAFGRKIAGRNAADMICRELPKIVSEALLYENTDEKALLKHVETAEDADFLRRKTVERGYVAFVANGSLLPRESGISQLPLAEEEAVLFKSPESCETSFELPNTGHIKGMGIKKGITLIAGGGYHGKSTLLNAVELGIYNHIPGDGREFVVTDPAAVKIRAEDGRRVEKVTISPFIKNLPMGKNTESFSSEDASGSTSQAANIMEYLEMGAGAFLIDEDTSATNFMIRDHSMQKLITKEFEPITPFIDKAKQLFNDHDVSTILVIGGSGDYFSIADTVIAMNTYLPEDVTEEARRIASNTETGRTSEGGESFGSFNKRTPVCGSIKTRKGKKAIKTQVRNMKSIQIGYENIDLSQVEQLVDICQTRAIAAAVVKIKKDICGNITMGEIMEKLFEMLEDEGLDILSTYEPDGSFAAFRPFECAAALNRLRTLLIK